jgi:hypothetical protein
MTDFLLSWSTTKTFRGHSEIGAAITGFAGMIRSGGMGARDGIVVNGQALMGGRA